MQEGMLVSRRAASTAPMSRRSSVRRTSPAHHRSTARSHGLELERKLCADFAQLVAQCPERPEPKETLRNIERQRPFSFSIFCVGLAAVAGQATVTRAQLAFFCRQLFVHLLAIAPVERLCVRGAWLQEADIEGRTNVAQIQAMQAVATGNRADLQRALEQTIEHRNAMDCLIEQYAAELRALSQAATPRLAGAVA